MTLSATTIIHLILLVALAQLTCISNDVLWLPYSTPFDELNPPSPLTYISMDIVVFDTILLALHSHITVDAINKNNGISFDTAPQTMYCGCPIVHHLMSSTLALLQ